MRRAVIPISIVTIIFMSLLLAINCVDSKSIETLQPPSTNTPIFGDESPVLGKELREEVTKTLSGFAGGLLENQGEKNAAVRYYIQSSQLAVGFGKSQLWFSISNANPEHPGSIEQQSEELQQKYLPPTVVSVTFPGSNPVVPEAEKPTGAYYNYYYGSDPTKWTTHNPYYERVVYRNLYEKIDLIYEIRDGQLKYEFIVYPGGDPQIIRVHWGGPISLSILSSGLQIVVQSPMGPFSMMDSNPISYQSTDRNRPIATTFQLQNTRTYGFTLPHYDPTRLLIIDPFLQYSTFLGSSGSDKGYALALDANGNVWSTGVTYDAPTDFPTTPDALNTTHNGLYDVFIAKLSGTGRTLLYSTFLGGSGNDQGDALALDANGNVWLTGYTASTNFPTTPDAIDTTHNGGGDVFIAKLSGTGRTLLYSTFLGGSSSDEGYALALDGNGNVWITGVTYDAPTDFPTTPDALNTTHNGAEDVFIAKLSSNGQTLLYSTFLGGSENDQGYALALDANGNVWSTGATYDAPTDFPTTPGALNTTHNGLYDVFIAKLSGIGQTLLYSTFLGGSDYDWGHALAIDANGNVWSTGATEDAGTDFPTTPDALYTTHNGGADVFVSFITNPSSTPQELSVTVSKDQTVHLVWEAPLLQGGAPITAYYVYRSTTSGNYGGFLAETPHTLFIDSLAASGQTYYYIVTALNTVGESEYSNEVNATLSSEITSPGAPESLSTIPGEHFVELNWNAPSSDGGSVITHYRVYRGIASGIYVLLALTTSTTFNDTTAVGGTTYYYIVTAVNAIGESAFSSEVGTTPLGIPDPTFTVPTVPQSLTVTPGENFVELSWTAPSNDGGSPITNYRVYRGTSSGIYELLALTTGLSFNDTTAAGGTTYYYLVTAVNGVGESAFSSEVSTTPTGTPDPSTTGPGAPQSLTTTPGVNFVELSWNTPTSDGGSPITSYRVYRGTISGEYLLLITTNATNFNDTTAIGGSTYYYVVTAINGVGESYFSTEASTTPTGTPAVTPSTPSAPQGLTATPGEQVITLSWTAPNNDGSSSITHYRIYRGTQSGEYILLAVVIGTSYNDTTVEEETTYYYLVTVANAVGESPFSNEVSTTSISLPEESSDSKDSAAPGFITIFLFLVVLVIVVRKRKESWCN